MLKAIMLHTVIHDKPDIFYKMQGEERSKNFCENGNNMNYGLYTTRWQNNKENSKR